VVRIYPDKLNKGESSTIPIDTFTDKIYFDIKELYDEAEENEFKISEADKADDEETFGWALADSWKNLGSVYIFPVAFTNLCSVDEEMCPVYDSKGEKSGDL